MLPRVLSLEMHSKRRYKICICSIIQGPGNLGLFKITSAFISIIFSGNFRCNLTYQESENCSDSSPHHIFECENFRLPFSTKNSLTWSVKCEKLNFRKSQGIIRYKLRKLYMNETVIQKYLAVLKLYKILDNI